jgi:hypothetical protein
MMSAHRLSDVRHNQLLGKSSFLPYTPLRCDHHVNQSWRTTVPMNYFLCLIPHRKTVLQCRMTSNVCVQKHPTYGNYSTLPIQDCTGAPPFPVRAGRRHGLACHSSRWQPFFFSPMRGGFVSRSSPGSFSQIILLLGRVQHWLPLSPGQPQFLCRVLDRALSVTARCSSPWGF